MTRAQFVTVLCRMFGWTPAEGAESVHPDCAGHWALSYIGAAQAHGVEDHAGVFRPDDPISRMEMAKMLVQALGYDRLAQTLSDTALPFPDVTSDKGYAAIAYDLGLITGVEQSGQLRFLPTFTAPREQAAALLVRCYERYHAKVTWLHGFYAMGSYSQLDYVDALDAVSAGWARLEWDGSAAVVNQTSAGGNDWVLPEGHELVTNRLAQGGTPCYLNVFGSASTFSALTAAGAQAGAVERLAAAAGPYSGLTIDIEGLKTDRRSDFTSFMAALRAALPSEKALNVCVQPDTWFGGYDYRALGESCDKVILMAHDYQWSAIPDYYLGTSHTYCPVTPFDQVYTALEHASNPLTGVQDKGKLALAISFNTTCFHVDDAGNLLDTTFYHPAMSTIAQRLGQPDSVRTWDEAAHNPSLSYVNEEGEHYQLWYEDAQSVSDKIQLAKMFGVTSISVWRLGTIPSFDGVPNYNVWPVFTSR